MGNYSKFQNNKPKYENQAERLLRRDYGKQNRRINTCFITQDTESGD
jgi:hypothetical protein